MFTYTNSYCYIVVGSKFIKVGRVRPTLVVRIILVVGRVEGVEVVMIVSLPLRTLVMNSNSEVFPTPVSPTRTRLYSAFALLLRVLMTPCTRESTSVGNTKDVVVTCLRAGVLTSPSSFKAYSRVKISDCPRGRRMRW